MIIVEGLVACACLSFLLTSGVCISSNIQVPLLGGAFCACTWHFFYNSESLEVSILIAALFGSKCVINSMLSWFYTIEFSRLASTKFFC